MSTRTTSSTPQPVTVTAARVVRHDRREAFEEWARDVQALAATYPGHLGSSTLRPGAGSDEYHLVYRFADADSLAAWERSAERAQLMTRLADLVEDERYARVEGLEGFFGRTTPAVPVWRLVVLTVLGVFLLTSSFHLVVDPFVADWPWPARLLLSAAVVVNGLRFVVMPALTRVFGSWLRSGPGR
ncbi:antibiotic biosynthesis monooxygenase [Klenkia sp. LSe6-5]|uniref:Antibiotic biosynthesis monooxygenase n=1 Tax=Klenkia sesuvii TaxID=3103137 RepID=A0ABU8DVJ0_9ACTN